MAWSYRKRFKIIPGVHLNVSKSGVSATIGVKGLSVTYGSKGTYANVGIPGTGIHNRFKIPDNTGYNSQNSETCILEPSFTPISSSDILTITSHSMEGVKELIEKTRNQRQEIKNDIEAIKIRIRRNRWHKFFLCIVFYIFKKKIKSISLDIQNQQNAVTELEEQLKSCYIKLDTNFDTEMKEKYMSLINSFKNLSQSQYIWHIVSERGISREERVRTRTSCHGTINRIKVDFGIQTLPEIKSDNDVLWLQNQNGHDLYFYPNFLIMYSSQEKYAIIDYSELQINYTNQSFVETNDIPKDSKIVRYTWNKVNKNGTPDRRFKDNYQIPVVAYGKILITSPNGVKEEYYCSNNEATHNFVSLFQNYKDAIKT